MTASAGACIGFDLGGGGVRALLLEPGSGRSWSASRPWQPFGAAGTGGLGVDLDPAEVWQALVGACADVLERSGVDPARVVGLAATAMRFGSVVLDDAGQEIYAVPNRDARAAGEGIRLALEQGESLQQRTGLWPLPLFATARLMWLGAQRPELRARADCHLALDDWIAWRLCGERATTPSQAGMTGAFELEGRRWADDLLEAHELPRSLFPDVVESGTRIGALSADAAAALGLPAGIAVAAGGGDSQCALLGSGAVSPGDVTIVGGTTVPLMAVCAAPTLDAEGRLWAGHHCVPDTWVLESNGGPMGEALEWTARMLFPDAPYPLARLHAEADASEPGAFGLLSTFGVEVQNTRDMAVPNGHLALTHLTQPHDANPGRHVARAVVEGVAFGIRANRDQLLEAIGGLDAAAPVRLCGGLSRSPSFATRLADVLGGTVQVSRTHDTTALGAALCAGVGAGVWPDLKAASGAAAAPSAPSTPSTVRAEHAPTAELRERYDTLYETWQQTRSTQAPARGAAAGHVMPWMLSQVDSTARGPGSARPQPRILACADLDESARGAFSELGELEYASYREKMRLLTGPSLIEALQGFEVFVTEVDIVDAKALAELPDLRVVATCRGDAVNVDVAACTLHGIPVVNAPGRNADAVADLTLAFLLMIARRLPEASVFLRAPDVRAGDMGKMGQAFSKLRGHELGGRSVGLVGFGAVGRAVAGRLWGFGARVLASDPFASTESAAAAGAERVPLETLLAESDIVSLHAAVTDETRGLLDADAFARMRPGSYLVNTARAALVDEDAMIAALESGQLAGAALDTFAVEPPGADHPLLQLDGVIATPHVGGNTFEVSGHQGRIVAEALAALLRGEAPRALLNPEVLERFDWSAPRPRPTAEELARLEQAPPPAVSDLQRDAVKRKADGPAATAEPEAAAPPPPDAAAATAGETSAPTEVVEGMARVLDAFLEDLCADAAIAEFAADKDVVLHFALTDVGLEFHFALQSGRVSGTRQAPESDAPVQLRMRAAILDGMLLGTLNAMEASMQGDISFTGDAAKAMTIQQLQSDMTRIYTAARERAGDPGDLEALAAAGPGEAAGAATAPVGAADVRQQIVAAVDELYRSELITATGGNVSARIPGSDEIWITPSQLFKGDLRPEAMVRLDLHGHSLDPGARSPSSEWSMHCAIFRARAEATAVVHAHAPHATILANAGLPFLPISTEAAFFGNIPRVPFIMPGTNELAEAVAEAMKDSWACLMVNHGLIVAGRSLRRAADMVEIIDRSAQVMLGCYAVGVEPPSLPDDVVATLRKMGDLVA